MRSEKKRREKDNERKGDMGWGEVGRAGEERKREEKEISIVFPDVEI